MNTQPIVIAGATATGKSDVAFAMARLLGGEIVSVDSMQVYRGLDIGTAKPDADTRNRVPHHLLDIVALTESFDAAQFVRLAHQVTSEIQGRDKVPIFCGGTGLYFNAWLNGLGTSPAPDPALRTELEALPTAALLEELARKDWQTFDEIDVSNRRRVVRAVEVIRLTGQPFSSQRAAWPERAPGLLGRSFGLERTREDLVARIEQRVDRMFDSGLVSETACLLQHGLESNRTAIQAIGYRQVVDHLRGRCGLRETIEQVKSKTRQLAKRQRTWFQGQMDIEWYQMRPAESPDEVARKLADRGLI